MFKNLKELIEQMPDEKTCREYLAKARWEDGKAICPYCGYGKCYDIENGGETWQRKNYQINQLKNS